MSYTVYDFAIIGAGAAGLQLALAMCEDDFFNEKKILILEKEDKNSNDRTWCFWETGPGKWDTILKHTWNKGVVFTPKKEIELEMGEYSYKMLRGLDFYSYAKEKLHAAPNFHWQKDEVKELTEAEVVNIKGLTGTYMAEKVFDSRISDDFFKAEDNYSRVLQHFKGWFIKTEEDVFDGDRFTLMDFRLSTGEDTSFAYVLPFSKRTALVEITFFTPRLEEQEVYLNRLKAYIEGVIKPGKYTVEEEEYGVIPMSDYPFQKYHTENITKIGTAGSWVKPSSGYSFKNAERYSQQLITNIKNGKDPSTGIPAKKWRFYDSLFLDILQNRNDLGIQLFSSMYSKNEAGKIFRFLDEETNFAEDLKIMSTFDPGPFMRAILKVLNR